MSGADGYTFGVPERHGRSYSRVSLAALLVALAGVVLGGLLSMSYFSASLGELELAHRADHDTIVRLEADVERLSAVLERQVSPAELAAAIAAEAERRTEDHDEN